MPEDMLAGELLNPMLRHDHRHGLGADTLQGDEQRVMPRVERISSLRDGGLSLQERGDSHGESP
jgi:hypothetical protein